MSRMYIYLSNYLLCQEEKDNKMFLNFFLKLKKAKIPVSINEFFNFLEVLNLGIIQYDIDKFYYLARMCLVKDEKLFDRFDILFGQYFKSIDKLELKDVLQSLNIPEEWLKKILEKEFSKKEIKKINSLGDFRKLVETFEKRLKEQRKRHQGGDKWIGTSGTSPFGAYGYNPEGIRINQNKSRKSKAIKVWEKRVFKDFDDSKIMDNRGLQVALKRLRHWARTGIDEELDIQRTINHTAKNGYLDIKTNKERENNIKILLFLDVGGSMDDYINQVEDLFSAAKSSFKNLKYFYFHNCLYEKVWKSNSRRWEEQYSTSEIFRTYSKDYKCIFVGDASMSPYEILIPGASNEYYNEESGKVWLERAKNKWPSNLWINPMPIENWKFTQSTKIINEIFSSNMVPLSISGIEEGTKILSKNY